jgi:hypothetical protein
VKGNEMELFNLEVSKWGISLTTYFGDVYVFWRSILLVVGIVVVLRIAKVIRKKVKK